MTKALELKLHSPAGSDPDVYEWPLTCGRGAGKNSGAVELVETIRWVCQEFPEIVMESNNLSSYNTDSYESMKGLVDDYNNAIDAFLQRAAHTTRPDERFNTTQRRTSRNLLRHILQQVYVHAVTNPSKLNQYEPFSPEVYGETSYELVCQIIDQLNITEEDTFLDLGSGVGQIVLQVAASTSCKMVWGIERSDWPNLFAKKMDLHFKRLMRWWGKPYGEYQLINGDFLDQRHSDKINLASVIFVNNLAFGPNLDHQLKERFAELRDGVRIISSKEFCPLNSRLSERNLSNIGTIMQVSKLSPPQGSVSWTGKSVSYYVHTIDRTKLKVYLKPLKETENTTIASTGHNNRDVDRILQPSDLVDASSPVIEIEVKSSGRIRTRRSLTAEKANSTNIGKRKPVKIGVKANFNPAGKPVGRVGKREDRGIKKKNSIREMKLLSSQSITLPKGKKPSPKHQQCSFDISSVHANIEKLNQTTQTLAVNDATDTPSSLQMYLDTIRSQMMTAVAMLKDENYRRSLMNDIEFERKRKNEMSLQAAELDAEISCLMQTEKRLRRQQEVMYRSRKLSRVNADATDISIVNQESALTEISLAIDLRKRLSCKITKVSSEVATSNQTAIAAALRPFASTSSRFKTSLSSPVQQQAARCVNAQSRTLKPESPHQPILHETFPVPSVLLGYDLEDRLKNLIISVLKDNAAFAAGQIRYHPFFPTPQTLKCEPEAERIGIFSLSPLSQNIDILPSTTSN